MFILLQVWTGLVRFDQFVSQHVGVVFMLTNQPTNQTMWCNQPTNQTMWCNQPTNQTMWCNQPTNRTN